MTITIPLTQGQVALIDDEDYPLVSGYKWHASLAKGTGAYYAKTIVRLPDGRKTSMQMSRLIMNAPRNRHVDHISRNTLDNRRANLRFATNGQNMTNTPAYRNNKSGFKGVYRSHNSNRWEAQIRYNKRIYWLGEYMLAEDAARAYDARAREVWGEFARCNFPLPDDTP